MNATGEGNVEPAHLHRADVPEASRHFFDLAPALALRDGPWMYSRHPRLGAVLTVCGWIVGTLLVLAIVLDQLRADTFLDDGNKIIAGPTVVLLAFMLLAGPGAFLKAGRLHHAPSRRRMKQSTETYRGTASSAAAIHTALGESDQRPVTWRDILQLTRGSRTEDEMGDIVVTTYEAARADYALATVHLRTADDEFVIWPPNAISRSVIPGLVQPTQDTTAWTSLS